MKLKFICAASLMALAAAVSAETLVTVNGQPIEKSTQDLLVSELVKSGGQDTPEARKKILETLVAGTILEQEASKLGIDKSPTIEAGMKLAKMRLLQEALADEYMQKHPVSEEQIKKYYDQQVERLGAKQYDVSHILVKDKAQAEDIIAKLNKGEKFEELAKQFTTDPGSPDGHLGWTNPSSFVKPFADAVRAMNKGDISKAPVESQFGWHVIKIDDVRAQTIPPLEQVKGQIAGAIEQQEKNQYLTNVLKSAKVEFPEAAKK